MGREKERAKARKSTIFAIMCNYDDRVSVGVRLRYFEENISKFKTSQKRRREMRSPGKREREREMERKIVNRLTKINRVTSIYAPTIFFTSFSFCLPEYLLNNFSIYLFLSSSMPLYNIFLSLPNHISICSSVFFFFFLFYLEFMPFLIRLSAFNLFFL